MNIAEQMPAPDNVEAPAPRRTNRTLAELQGALENELAGLQGAMRAERAKRKELQAKLAALEADSAAPKIAQLEAEIASLKSEMQEYATLYALSEHNLKMALANLNLHRARQNGHHH